MSNNLKSKAVADPPFGGQLSHPAPVPRGAMDRGRTRSQGKQRRYRNSRTPGRNAVIYLSLFSAQMDDMTSKAAGKAATKGQQQHHTGTPNDPE
jgi:hypothetical protein